MGDLGSLSTSYAAWKAKWLAGSRERETALQLMFHAWMHWAEPDFLTGLNDEDFALAVWHDIFESMGGEASSDVEFLFAAGTMVALFPYMLKGDERLWAERGAYMMEQADRAGTLTVAQFEGRGEYGDYFSHMLMANRS